MLVETSIKRSRHRQQVKMQNRSTYRSYINKQLNKISTNGSEKSTWTNTWTDSGCEIVKVNTVAHGHHKPVHRFVSSQCRRRCCRVWVGWRRWSVPLYSSPDRTAPRRSRPDTMNEWMNEWMNECLTTPQHEKQIGYWVSEKGICMKWLYN